MINRIQKPYYNSETDTMGQFVIVEDGAMALEAAAALERKLRFEALQYVGAGAIRGIGHSMRTIGHAILLGLDEFVTSA